MSIETSWKFTKKTKKDCLKSLIGIYEKVDNKHYEKDQL